MTNVFHVLEHVKHVFTCLFIFISTSSCLAASGSTSEDFSLDFFPALLSWMSASTEQWDETPNTKYNLSNLVILLFTILCCVFLFCLYAIHLIALCYGKYRLYRKVTYNKDAPGVSIIKPIVGIDSNLEENLETFFRLSYHKFELLFCFQVKDDPAIDLVKRMISEFPDIDSKIFYGGEKIGLNPKLNNMMPAYRASKYPLVLVSDSGIYMRPDALMDMVNSMKKDIAIVTQTPYCKDRSGFAGAVEQVYFGTNHGRMYLAGNCMGFVCSTGMSSLLRKSALEECGGFPAFGGYLAEDFFFGLETSKRNWGAVISSYPALQNSGGLTVHRFHDRICRWMKLRIAMLPHIILVEPFQDCFASGAILSYCCWYFFGTNLLAPFLIHCVIWFIVDYSLIHIIQNGPLPFSFWQYVQAWFFREGLGPVIFLKALRNPDIRWRNGTFRLRWGGTIKST